MNTSEQAATSNAFPTPSDTKGYDAKLVSKQLQALVGHNTQYYFSSLNKVLVKWNNKWCEFDEFNKVFKVL